jgi:hypothetical protein
MVFPPMLVGYMRVSSESDRQTTDLQRDALLAPGVDGRHLFADHASGTNVNDSESTGAAALAREVDTPRLRRADPADLGVREPLWSV